MLNICLNYCLNDDVWPFKPALSFRMSYKNVTSTLVAGGNTFLQELTENWPTYHPLGMYIQVHYVHIRLYNGQV